MQILTNKSFLSPLLAVFFTAMAVSGVLMLLDIKLSRLHALHQWGGLLFAIGGMIHLILNWRIFASYFKNNKAAIGVVAGVLVLAFIAVISPAENGRHHHGRGAGSHHAETQR